MSKDSFNEAIHDWLLAMGRQDLMPRVGSIPDVLYDSVKQVGSAAWSLGAKCACCDKVRFSVSLSSGDLVSLADMILRGLRISCACRHTAEDGPCLGHVDWPKWFAEHRQHLTTREAFL